MTFRGLFLLVALLPLTAAFAEDWPQWHGPKRDNLSKETGLLKEWPKAGPKLLWTYKDAGIGLSGVSIVGNRLYTMGAFNEEEYLYALDLFDKKPPVEAWKVKVGPIWTMASNVWGDGPRSTPTVDGNRVYALGGQGILICSDIKGTKLWAKDLVKDFGGKIMESNEGLTWGFCESVLVDGDRVVCCPGGQAGVMMAFNKVTGDEIWRTKEVKGEASDGSMVVAEFGGVRQYVQTYYAGAADKVGGCIGVSAEDGKVLWQWTTPRYNIYAISPTPIVVGDSVLLSANEKAGCDWLKITKNEKGEFKVEEQYGDAIQRKTMSNTHGGMVLLGKHLYGFADNRGWVCQDLATGKEVWSERRKLGAQKTGCLTYADGCLYLFSDAGEVGLIIPSPEGWAQAGQFKVPEEPKSRIDRKTSGSSMPWTHPVVANGRLFLRDQELLFCYDVKK